jgi:zinc/manganese transport system permease protein
MIASLLASAPPASALASTGFFHSSVVLTALAVGPAVAIVTGVVGVFTVVRGQSFAGHALADMGAVGGSAAFLLGVNQLWGFVVAGLLAAAFMEVAGVKRMQGRDVATGIVFGLGLGLTALFLYLDTTVGGSSNAAVSVLFGSLFVIDTSLIPVVLVLSAIALVTIAGLYRWLQFDAISADMAFARGVPVRLTGILFLMALALAVQLSAMTIGAILSTALLIGPAATVLRFTRRIGVAVIAAALLGAVITVAGIALAYVSYGWFHGQNWPVSFCIVAIVFVVYLAAGPLSSLSRRRRETLIPVGEHL